MFPCCPLFGRVLPQRASSYFLHTADRVSISKGSLEVADEELVGAAATPGFAARDGGTSLATPQPARRR